MPHPTPHEPRLLGTTLRVNPAQREEARQTLRLLGEHFHAQEGCLAYLILEGELELTFLTVWRDGRAMSAHLASEACRILLGAASTLGDAAPFSLPRPEAYPLVLPPSAPHAARP